jgi:putative hydrolase of the HAD superfamily
MDRPNTRIVFDIDDTLYLERDYVWSGFAAVGRLVLREFGKAGFAESAWEKFRSGARGRIFDEVVAELGVGGGRRTVSRLVAEYRGHAPAISLLPDAVSFLEKEFGRRPLGCITDGPEESQEAKVRALALHSWLKPIILTAALGPRCGKPSLVSYKRMQKELRGLGECFVYVGDNPLKDFAGAARLGWYTVRIRRAGSLHEVEPNGPDVMREIRELGELFDVVA